MGLLEFFNEAGANLFGRGKNEAEEIQKLLEANFSGKITNLKVEFQDGVVKLYGTCDSQATKEKAILLAGNVKGVKGVDDAYLSTPVAEVKQEVEFYVVKPGDTLSKIAKQYLGDANKYPAIFEANREVIRDPNLIYPGQKLRIPR